MNAYASAALTSSAAPRQCCRSEEVGAWVACGTVYFRVRTSDLTFRFRLNPCLEIYGVDSRFLVLFPLKTDLDLSGFEDLMRNNEKLREEKEELRTALSQLEEEVWQFRQKEVTVAKNGRVCACASDRVW